VVFALSACNKKTEQVGPQSGTVVYTVERLMEEAEAQVGKEVEVKGTVTHVCRHSGKKCFLSDKSGDLSMRIAAGGSIEAFDQALKGSDIIVKGVLREGDRISREDIQAQEEEVNEEMLAEQAQEGDHHKHCQARLNNIRQMQEWMAKHNKDYYALYYIEGTSYEVAL
jgi:hypothetical protein